MSSRMSTNTTTSISPPLSADASTIFKAISSRLLLFAHGILCVYLYTKNANNNNFWLLVMPLVLLLVETCVTIFFKKGREYKYVWPSGFLYITCVIPVIWLIELDLYDSQLNNRIMEEEKMTFKIAQDTEQEKIRRQIVLFVIDGAKQSGTLKKICELGLIICIIIARWCMPRGDLTKDQLSALLLVYVGNSADILELFDTFEEPEVIEHKPVVIAIMSIFTWSMYQFALITTATIKGEETPDSEKNTIRNIRNLRVSPATVYTGNELKRNRELQQNYIGEIRTKNRKISGFKPYDSFNNNRGRGKKISVSAAEKAPINVSATNQKKQNIKQRELHGELYQILVTLLMQDGPFLMLRLYLLIEMNVASEMHIFFTCKNAIVSLLLIYRLLILSCTGKDEVDELDREDASTKLHNIQVAMELTKTRDMNMADISVK